MRRNGTGPGPFQQRDLELIGGERFAFGAEHPGTELDRGAELHSVFVLCREGLGDLLGLTAEDRVALFVHDDAVVEEVVHLAWSSPDRPTSATRSSTSYGFISWVNTWPSVCTYTLASSLRRNVFA